ncbi:hypothetical protein Vadar_020179 [Vaccinium darrowii]|uniref:Uncharacterized protein n=1 Tax=Vaccinium darrowii TaxID=229202 RepID=A0ACB7XBM6_9ERIC|nr:hypothetical protein Vadar_020179 [Vaccinium darrowii]
MPRYALFAFTICFLTLIPIITAVPTYTAIDCPNATLSTTPTYAQNSTYQTNLNTLFSVLSSNSTVSNGFYNFTAGTSSPDVAYGLFLCRGDVSAAVCQDCVGFATTDVIERCPTSKRVTIWYDQCLLRYSNASIFGTADTVIWITLANPSNVANATRFSQILGEVMDDVANRASSDNSGKKFATAKANISSLEPLYGLGQCTPDLSVSDCNSCLRDGITKLPDDKQGGRVLFRSCYVWFEMYPFYNDSFGAAPPPPPPVVSAPGGEKILIYEFVPNKSLDYFLFDPQEQAKLDWSRRYKIIGGAWKLWREGRPLDLMDPTLEGSHSRTEVTRCIHIALLCVQDDPDARPSMATVVLMLNSYSTTLSLPQQPGFLGRSKPGSNSFQALESDQSTSKSMQWSINKASVTELDPR